MSESKIANPLARAAPVERPVVGALAHVEQQRAVAEVQARMMIARAHPRDPVKCMDLILQDCMRESLANSAVYQYARGGENVSGPNIRLAEAIARRWGNIASGIKEISRSGGYSECVAYAWDLETGYYDERQFQVKHWRDTRKGGYAITEERDIYELVANMGQRRKRAVLLSVIPGDVIDAAVSQCELTMTANADLSEDAMAKMIASFADFGVTKEQIEKRIQRRIDAIRPAQVVSLRKIYVSLRDGMSEPADWFDGAEVVEHPQGESDGRGEKKALDPYPDDRFKKNLPNWRKLIADGRQTAEQIIGMLSSRNALTDAQKTAISENSEPEQAHQGTAQKNDPSDPFAPMGDSQ